MPVFNVDIAGTCVLRMPPRCGAHAYVARLNRTHPVHEVNLHPVYVASRVHDAHGRAPAILTRVLPSVRITGVLYEFCAVATPSQCPSAEIHERRVCWQ